MKIIRSAALLALLLATGLAAPAVRAQTPAALMASGRTRAQLAAIRQEADARTPAQRKIASSLLYAAKESATGSSAVAAAPKLRSGADLAADGRVKVKIKADISPELLAQIKLLGGDVQSSYPQYRAIYATLPLNALETLAVRADVEFIGPPPGISSGRARQPQASADAVSQAFGAAALVAPAANSVNDPQGDVTHGADKARAQYGATGKGMKVAVISDSVDDGKGAYQAALLNGYVSNVTIVPGQASATGKTGEGEGLAMLEAVHRLAPDAQLFFATGFNGEEQMALNINALVADGCNVIIDDVFNFGESPFQDGVVAQAMNAASDKGVLCFTCAANYGNQDSGTSSCWEGDFKGDAQNPTFLDFQPGQLLNGVADPGGQSGVYLFWSEPAGNAASSYYLYEADQSGNIVQVANSNGRDPVQSLQNVGQGGYIAVEKHSGSSRFLHVDLVTQGTSFQFGTAGHLRGHNGCGAANSFTVAATPAAAAQTSASPAGPYPALFSSGDKVETFSNDGPRRVFFNPDGTAITPGNFSATGGLVRAKPDFTAADGVSTSLPAGGGLNPFFGTSCATPHAGALAAMLLSYNPALTPAQVGAALRGGTVQVTNPGSGNRDAGAGILLAPNILQAVSTPPSIIAFSPANGPAGTLVTVTGINLNTAVSAAVNGTPAAYAVVNSNALTLTIPAGAATGRVTVLTAGGLATSAANFTLTASVATPVVSSAAAANGQAGSAFTYQITATNNPTTYGAAGLPPGLAVNAAGLIAGIPTAPGTFPVTISAGNAAGGSSSATLTLTILPAPPALTSASSAGGQVGVAFGFQLSASNGPTGFAAAGLPPGLAINPATGFISGTPAAAGTFTATVSATNAGGTSSATLTLAILPPAPALTSAGTATGQVGVPFGFQLAGSNGPTGFAAAGLPAGLVVNPASGLISGTPAAPGTFPVTVSAANTGGTGTGTLTLTILPAPPVVTSALSASGQQGAAFTYQITASNAPTAYAAANLPAGLALDPATGVISGTPAAAGTFPVTVAASNAGGTGSAVLTLTLAVPIPVVTLTVPTPTAGAASGVAGQFLLTLSSAQAGDVVVAYVVKGSAVNGTDYVLLKGTKKIKAGKTSKPINVVPQGDLGGADKKVVKLTLTAGAGYTVGTTAAAKVKIVAGQ